MSCYRVSLGVFAGDAREMERAVPEAGDVRRHGSHLRVDQTRGPLVHRADQRQEQPGKSVACLSLDAEERGWKYWIVAFANCWVNRMRR